MNKIETLPKELVYNGVNYLIHLHVNAWGNLVICYRSMFKVYGQFIDIFSYCVEYKNEPYIPKIFAADMGTGLNGHIGNCKSLDDCIEQIGNRIQQALKDNEIELPKFDLSYYVNACLKGKISGNFVTRSGVKIPGSNIVPLDPKSPLHVCNGGYYSFETIPGTIVEIFLTDSGRIMPEKGSDSYYDTELDIVDFVLDENK